MKMRSRTKFWVGSALALAAAVGLAWADDTTCPGTCARTWHTNIHYSCTSPGAACGVGCVCRNVRGNIWRDCYCLKPTVTGKPEPCLSNGGWQVLTAAPLNPGATVACQLVHTPGNELEVFSAGDIGVDPDGTVGASAILNGPADFQGTMVVRVLNGPPDQIPIEIVSLSLVSASVPIGPLPSGPNNVTLGPGPAAQGMWDTTTGRIRFDTPFPIIVQNNLYPAGLDGVARPTFECPPGLGVQQLLLQPHGVIPLPAGIPTVSEWGMIIIGLGMLTGGVFAMRWFGRPI